MAVSCVWGVTPEPPELPAVAEPLHPEEGIAPAAFMELWRPWEGSSLVFLLLGCIPSTVSQSVEYSNYSINFLSEWVNEWIPLWTCKGDDGSALQLGDLGSLLKCSAVNKTSGTFVQSWICGAEEWEYQEWLKFNGPPGRWDGAWKNKLTWCSEDGEGSSSKDFRTSTRVLKIWVLALLCMPIPIKTKKSWLFNQQGIKMQSFLRIDI